MPTASGRPPLQSLCQLAGLAHALPRPGRLLLVPVRASCSTSTVAPHVTRSPPCPTCWQVARATVGLIIVAAYVINHFPARGAIKDLVLQTSGRSVGGPGFVAVETLAFFFSTLALALLVTDLGERQRAARKTGNVHAQAGLRAAMPAAAERQAVRACGSCLPCPACYPQRAPPPTCRRHFQNCGRHLRQRAHPVHARLPAGAGKWQGWACGAGKDWIGGCQWRRCSPLPGLWQAPQCPNMDPTLPPLQYARSKHVESRKRRQLLAEAGQLEAPLLDDAAAAAANGTSLSPPPLYSLWCSKLFWSGVVLLLLSAALLVLTVFTTLHPLPEA